MTSTPGISYWTPKNLVPRGGEHHPPILVSNCIYRKASVPFKPWQDRDKFNYTNKGFVRRYGLEESSVPPLVDPQECVTLKQIYNSVGLNHWNIIITTIVLMKSWNNPGGRRSATHSIMFHSTQWEIRGEQSVYGMAGTVLVKKYEYVLY